MNKRLSVDVLSIVSKELGIGVDDITLESSIFNIAGWDSLAHINIILAVEKGLGHQFSIDDIVSVESVRDLLNIVEKYQKV